MCVFLCVSITHGWLKNMFLPVNTEQTTIWRMCRKEADATKPGDGYHRTPPGLCHPDHCLGGDQGLQIC